jgi:hypothetical protein
VTRQNVRVRHVSRHVPRIVSRRCAPASVGAGHVDTCVRLGSTPSQAKGRDTYEAAIDLLLANPGTAASLRIAPSHRVISAGTICGAIFARQAPAIVEDASGRVPVDRFSEVAAQSLECPEGRPVAKSALAPPPLRGVGPSPLSPSTKGLNEWPVSQR